MENSSGFFSESVDRSGLVPGLVEVHSTKPVTPQLVEALCEERQIKPATVRELEQVRVAYWTLKEAVSGQLALNVLSAMMRLPTLVVLGTTASERNGCAQYLQLVEGQIRETTKNKPGWPAHTHFLFLRS